MFDDITSYLYILPLGYLGLFIIFTFLKTISITLDRWIFCTVCFTWATHLVIGFIFLYPAVILTFMLGMTISGIAIKSEIFLQDREKTFPASFFIIQLILTILGLILVVMMSP